MTASDMLCDHCGALIVLGQRKTSVNRDNPARKPGLQVAGEGEFSKANISLYHTGPGTDNHGTGKSCFQHAESRA